MIITNKLGPTFSLSHKVMGYILIAIGALAVIFSGNPWLLIMVAAGIALTTTVKMVRIDTSGRTVLDFNLYYGFIRSGERYAIDDYPYIAILKKRESSHITSLAMNRGKISDDSFYDVHLLNHNHRKKLLIGRYTDIESAQLNMEKIAELTGCTMADYAPVLSQASRMRRRR